MGGPVLGEWLGPFVDEVAAYRLATEGDAERPVADWLTLDVHVGVEWLAESVIAADPDNEAGTWGSDLLATVTLSGNSPDWALVNRIWDTIINLWPTVPWDEMSGFQIMRSRL
ncbi:hypothetical protein ACWERV_32945 [Streptomyces sp. NPDC004031]